MTTTEIIIKPKKASWIYLFFKRFFDIFLSFLAIVLLSPLLLILFIIGAISTKGAPIYGDKRVGKKGKAITVLKFRSMYKDANSNIRKYLNDEQYQQFITERKVDNDPRITKFGRFIRKTSLDELPQLFNIFAGQMSIVGSRPIVRKELDDNYSQENIDIILSARPGLTGWWQVSGRSEADYSTGERQKLELEYYEKRSFWFDTKIVFKTIPAILKKKGAK